MQNRGASLSNFVGSNVSPIIMYEQPARDWLRSEMKGRWDEREAPLRLIRFYRIERKGNQFGR